MTTDTDYRYVHHVRAAGHTAGLRGRTAAITARGPDRRAFHHPVPAHTPGIVNGRSPT
jgi:hypothetical protein